MLALLMTYSDDWIFYADHLKGVARVGRDRFAAIMRELKDAGYVQREPIRGLGGRVEGSHWVILDEPGRPTDFQGVGATDQLESRQTALPTVGESTLLRKPNGKEDQLVRQRPSGKIEFPENWKPSAEVHSWAKGQGFSDEQVFKEALHCAVHYRGRGDRFADLDLVFKAWMITARKFAGKPVNTSTQVSAILARVNGRHCDLVPMPGNSLGVGRRGSSLTLSAEAVSDD